MDYRDHTSERSFPRLRDFQDQQLIRATGMKWLGVIVGLVAVPCVLVYAYSDVNFLIDAPFACSAATLLLLASVITVLLSARSLSALQNLHIHHYERRLQEETTADLLDAFRHRHGLSETEVFVVVALLDHRIPGWRD
jgi:hypothetical protein